MNQYAEIIVFLLVGTVTGVLADRGMKQRKELEVASAQLAECGKQAVVGSHPESLLFPCTEPCPSDSKRRASRPMLDSSGLLLQRGLGDGNSTGFQCHFQRAMFGSIAERVIGFQYVIQFESMGYQFARMEAASLQGLDQHWCSDGVY